MKILQVNAILIKKNLYLSKGYGARKAVERISRQWLETWKHQQSAEENTQDWNNCPATKQRQTAFSA